MNTALVSVIICKIEQALQAMIVCLRQQPDFQNLQKRWLGLHLCANAANHTIQLRVLTVGRNEWLTESDFIPAKIIHQEFSQAGGRPFGLLIIDEPLVLDPHHTLILSELSETAHQAFVPMLFNQPSENADTPMRADVSAYIFKVAPELISPQGEWIGAAYGCAAMLCSVYSKSQWFYETESLQSLYWELPALVMRPAEKFDTISRAHLRVNGIAHTELQLEEQYPFQKIRCKAPALMALLALTRFAHYLKIMLRDHIGSEDTPDHLVRRLANWLRQYCAEPSSNTFNLFYPLANCEVSLCTPRQSDRFSCHIELTLNGLDYQSVSWVL